MPGMNGRELADQLLEWNPEIKIIHMSGYTDDIISHHGVLDTGVTFINKPIIPGKLANIVRSVLDEK
jgi:FixJ family two-component response regulator